MENYVGSRRSFVKSIATGAVCAASGSSAFASESTFKSNPRRVIFFIQNNGFDPATCVPAGMTGSGSLAGKKLPEPIKALEPFKERLHIINGLHGLHTSPGHSAFFGALGGYRGGNGVGPAAATIDYRLSQELPKGLIDQVCIGMDSMGDMLAKPTVAGLSARGVNDPLFMHSNPNHLYQLLYGSIAEGEIHDQYSAETQLFQRAEDLIANRRNEAQRNSYSGYQGSLSEINQVRKTLANSSDKLLPYAPKMDDLYKEPEFETDWHDRLLDLGISSLKSGLTNVLTIGSGRGNIRGAWQGLGIEKQGHGLGHMYQPDNPIWIAIRQYNVSMLIKIMEELESIPEGSGSMMDNTLIVYTSCSANKQHTRGDNWPVMLLGNYGGAIKTGRLTQYEGDRPINALYSSFLRATGVDADRFNMSEGLASKYDSGNGPLREVLV